MIDIEFSVECDNKSELEELIREAAQYTMEHEHVSASVNITVVSQDEIQRINREFRDTDKVTDVLSFPACDGSEFDFNDGFLGDIAICLKRAQEQANEYGHSLRREIAFLTVHGMLHILGYDHISQEDEAIMFPLQNKILEEMRILR